MRTTSEVAQAPFRMPPNVKVLWNTEDTADPERYITGAHFHTAELRLNQGVDLSPNSPLPLEHAQEIFLRSIGFSTSERVKYLNTTESTANKHVGNAQKKLRAKGHHAIRSLFTKGIIEVVQPIILPEPPDEEVQRLPATLCAYRTMREAIEQERGFETVYRNKLKQYELRGMCDFMTWAHAAQLLDSSPPVFTQPIEDASKPAPFSWQQTADGFNVDVFDKAEPCATLEFKGRYRQTAQLQAIIVEGGHIAVKHFFDTEHGRTYFSRAELGALAILCLGGSKDDIGRLGIQDTVSLMPQLSKKLGVATNSRSRGRLTKASFDKEIMTCEVPPEPRQTLTDAQHEYVRLLGQFDSYRAIAAASNLREDSIITLLSKITTASIFPRIAGVHFVLHAADEYAAKHRR